MLDRKIIITTDRMTLREVTLDDTDRYFQILGDPLAMKHYPQVYSREESAQWVERTMRRYETDGYGFYACELKDSGQFVGICGPLAQEIDGVREFEVGYLFVREHWGKGLATEAACACRDFGFRNYPIEHIISIIAPSNEASIRVAQNNGMSFWKEAVFKGEVDRIYRVTRRNWEQMMASRASHANG
jgi:RimJ/RimL family protein N-acetyltransferase